MKPFPNLPGTFESGPFRVHLNKFAGRKEVTLFYRNEHVTTFDAAELIDLEEVVSRISLFVTDESYAKLPPDEG